MTKLKLGKFQVVGALVMVALVLFIVYGWKRTDSRKNNNNPMNVPTITSQPQLQPQQQRQAASAYIRPNLGQSKGCSACSGRK